MYVWLLIHQRIKTRAPNENKRTQAARHFMHDKNKEAGRQQSS
jgi:hypothetical protein